MKPAAVQALRRTLAADRPAFGLWVTLESPSITEMAVALGLDWVVVDAEHGHLDWRDIANHLRAIDSSFAIIASFPEIRDKPVVIGESDPDGCAAC